MSLSVMPLMCVCNTVPTDASSSSFSDEGFVLFFFLLLLIAIYTYSAGTANTAVGSRPKCFFRSLEVKIKLLFLLTVIGILLHICKVSSLTTAQPNMKYTSTSNIVN